MPNDFFHDDTEDEPYQDITDWYQDIKHLIIPFLCLLFLGCIILISHFQ